MALFVHTCTGWNVLVEIGRALGINLDKPQRARKVGNELLIDHSTTARVQQQYELLPYPHRDPADEAKRIITTPVDELLKLNHYCYRGRRDFTKGFRVLVAGGGTGDSTIYLAQQLRDTNATIVHLDLSEASIEVARKRARRRGLEDNISWRRGSLLNLPLGALGPFDYINCGGVLHHLDDPAKGLAALRSVLCDDGAMGIFVYGRYGRIGIYMMQELMRMVNHDEADTPAKLRNTKALLAALPPSHCLRQRMNLLGQGELDDAEILDRYLHTCDRAFTVSELYDLLAGAGLHLAEFIMRDRLLYRPEFTFRDPQVLSQVKKLPRPQQQAAAELFWGTISQHMFWASPSPHSVADPKYPDNVPQWSQFAQQQQLQRAMLAEQGDTWTFGIQRPDGITYSFRIAISGVTRRIIELLDGRRTIGEIIERVAAGGDEPNTEAAWNAWLKAFGVLQSFDMLLLRHVSVPGFGETLTGATSPFRPIA